MEPPERLTNLQTLWDSQTVAELGPCGECVCFQIEMYNFLNCHYWKA